MITTDNYEGYLMRYADGELDAKESAMVEAFLDANPELRQELDAITAPSLKITPPLAMMPGKETLMHEVVASKKNWQPIWYSIAAAIALLVVFGIMLRMGHQTENPILAQISGIRPVSVADTPLPDSLYIGRGKPAPVYLAKQIKHQKTVEYSPAINETDNEEKPTEETIAPPENSSDQMMANLEVPLRESPVRRHGNVVVIETDQLVILTPKPEERQDMQVCSVIENNNIALNEEKGLIGKAFDAVTRFILRRTDSDNNTFYAFSE